MVSEFWLRGDFFLVVVAMVLVCLGITVLYVVALRKGQKAAQPGHLLIAALGLGQMVTVVQQLTVIQQFKIEQLSMQLAAFNRDHSKVERVVNIL